VTASFAQNVLVFTTQPANVTRGNALGAVVVTEEDGSGNTVDDNAMVTFGITACGNPLVLGAAQMNHGVATLNVTQRFYTLGTGLTVTATAGSLSNTSAAFSIVTASEYLFADGYEGCRL